VATTVNIHEAKTHFSKLLARVSVGEEIIIAKAGKPVARLGPIESKAVKRRVPGIDRGTIWMSEDFDVMPERELDEWYRMDTKLK
jgi:prevent-host-death family protein